MKSSYFIRHFSRLGIAQTSLALHSAHRISSIVVLVCCLPLFLSCMKGDKSVVWTGDDIITYQEQTVIFTPHTTKCNPTIDRIYYGTAIKSIDNALVTEPEDGVFKGDWVNVWVENKRILASVGENQTGKIRRVCIHISDGVTPGGHIFHIMQYPYVE